MTFLFLLKYFQVALQCSYVIPTSIVMNLEKKEKEFYIETLVFQLLTDHYWPLTSQTFCVVYATRFFEFYLQSTHFPLGKFIVKLTKDNEVGFWFRIFARNYILNKEEWLSLVEQRFALVKMMSKVENLMDKLQWRQKPSSKRVMFGSVAKAYGLNDQLCVWVGPRRETMQFARMRHPAMEEGLSLPRYGLEVSETLFVIAPEPKIVTRHIDGTSGLLRVEDKPSLDALWSDFEKLFEPKPD